MILFRAALGWINAAYVLGLLCLLAALEWWGERNWVLSVLLYIPPQVWLLPLAVLMPASLIWRPRLCFVQAACVMFVAFVFMHVRWHGKPERRPEMLTLVTNNVGQANRLSFDPFLKEQDPDFLVLQETGNRPYWLRRYPDRFVATQGEFVVVSKYPVRSATPVNEAKWLGTPVAARFEFSFQGRPVVIYNIHLPTPRQDFAKLRGAGLIKEVLGRNRRRSDGRSYSESMEARVELAKKLCDAIAAETQPCLVAGDFNMPDRGFIYHLFAARFTDAFAKSGRGWGLTFPGFTHNPLTGFGPWMRLDQLFAGKGWEPVYSQAEPRRRSQHRAMMAVFRPVEKS